MSHSLVTAGRRTHGKIFVVAAAFAGLATFAGLGFGQPARGGVAKQQTAQGVVKAIKPSTTAARRDAFVR